MTPHGSVNYTSNALDISILKPNLTTFRDTAKEFLLSYFNFHGRHVGINNDTVFTNLNEVCSTFATSVLVLEKQLDGNNGVLTAIIPLNIAVEWLACLKVPGSNFGLETGYHNEGISRFSFGPCRQIPGSSATHS